MSDWTDELKQEVVDAYLAGEPTPENTMEIVAQVAEEFDKTPNGVRMVLTKADVYVKKAAPVKSGSGASSDKPKRVSKADAIEALEAAIEGRGGEVDSDITSKLTGKAAQYFTAILTAE